MEQEEGLCVGTRRQREKKRKRPRLWVSEEGENGPFSTEPLASYVPAAAKVAAKVAAVRPSTTVVPLNQNCLGVGVVCAERDGQLPSGVDWPRKRRRANRELL